MKLLLIWTLIVRRQCLTNRYTAISNHLSRERNNRSILLNSKTQKIKFSYFQILHVSHCYDEVRKKEEEKNNWQKGEWQDWLTKSLSQSTWFPQWMALLKVRFYQQFSILITWRVLCFNFLLFFSLHECRWNWKRLLWNLSHVK